MRNIMHKKNIPERGQMLVIFAMATIGLVAMAAFAIDGSMVLADRRHAQNAADTAVMAGALTYVRECEATGCDNAADVSSAKAAMEAAALDRADSNGYTDDSTRSEVEVHTCDEADASCAAPYAGDDSYIQLVITSHVDTFFAPVVGVQTLTNRVQAVAMAIPGSETSCPTCKAGGVDLSGIIDNELFFFANGSVDANWQGATKGFVGNVVVNGIIAKERTSGGVPYAGTISTNDSTLSAWQNIVNQNSGQAFASLNQTTLVANQKAKLIAAFQQINAMPVSTAVSTTGGTRNFDDFSSKSLDGVNTTGFGCQTIVVNITRDLQVKTQINITGDACDIFILRWDTDQNFTNGYQGQVKFQSGGAIVPLGELKASNFIHVAGDINASGGGSTPTANGFPQGPRLNNGTGALIVGGSDFSGGGFFTGYWLTTGAPSNLDTASGLYYGNTASLSNAIFVGGWYSITDKFSMTSGTSGVYVTPSNGSASSSPGSISLVK